MATLNDLLRHHTALSEGAQAHLRRLVAGWGPLSDLSFGDLLLFAPAKDRRLLVVGQVRPTTNLTLYRNDHVGLFSRDRPLVEEALATGQPTAGTVQRNGLSEPVQIRAIPVRHNGVAIGVLVSESLGVARGPGELERMYLGVVDRLFEMVAAGAFPYPFDDPTTEGSPRVGDGVMVLDADGTVEYTSPNAVSALHRMGFHANAMGRSVTDLGLPRDVIRTAFALRTPLTHVLERGDSVAVQLRLLPLLAQGRADGALVLMRDISDIRRQERLLVSMDATIREIHHRVKNNLQTVSSLLRMQGRRVPEPAAKTALDEAARRIRSIALVHEVLSRDGGDDVALEQIVQPVVEMVRQALVDPDHPIDISLSGAGPVVSAATASNLAVVLTELIQNAVEHGFPEGFAGQRRVRIDCSTRGRQLTVTVSDTGVGLTPNGDVEAGPGLGLTIINTLATADLGGRFELTDGENGQGAVARLVVQF